MFFKKRNVGFTLIELLVVISIISLLSSIVFSMLREARDKAIAARIVLDYQEIEKAFLLAGSDAQRQDWWLDSEFSAALNGHPTIDEIRADTSTSNFGTHLLSTPVPPIGWVYDYNFDNNSAAYVLEDCGGTDNSRPWEGVTLQIRGIPQEVHDRVFPHLNMLVDGTDVDSHPVQNEDRCGKALHHDEVLPVFTSHGEKAINLLFDRDGRDFSI